MTALSWGWWKQNPWAVVIAGLLLFALLWTQGGPAGALGTLGLLAVAFIFLAYLGRSGKLGTAFQ